jgi:streptomycin 6-kinase
MEPIKLPAIKLHNGFAVPQRVVTKVSEFAAQRLTPNWLSSLPMVIADVCAKWHIELESVAADTYMTLVLFGRSPSLGPVVIKSTPISGDFVAQARAFEIAAGDNVPRVYDVDFERCTMVMERIVPGTPIRDVEMHDETSTRIAAEMLVDFWRPVSHVEGLLPLRVMQPLTDWTPRPDVISTDLVAQSLELAASLLQRSTRTWLLHGDVHQWNIVQRASGEWVFIDLCGIFGDPGIEIARWMHNPPEIAEREDFLGVAARRLRIWSDITGTDADDLASWALVGNVLNAINCIDFAPEVMRVCLRVAEGLQTFVR